MGEKQLMEKEQKIDPYAWKPPTNVSNLFAYENPTIWNPLLYPRMFVES